MNDSGTFTRFYVNFDYYFAKKKQIKKKTLLYYELESRLVVGIYSDLLRVLGLDLGSSGSIKLIIIKCFVRQVLNFEGGGRGCT
jgi:hypothetical protein